MFVPAGLIRIKFITEYFTGANLIYLPTYLFATYQLKHPK